MKNKSSIDKDLHSPTIKKLIKDVANIDTSIDTKAPIFRNKKTGTVYETVSVNGTGIAEVTTIKGSKYLVDESSLEQVNPTRSTPTALSSIDLDGILERYHLSRLTSQSQMAIAQSKEVATQQIEAYIEENYVPKAEVTRARLEEVFKVLPGIGVTGDVNAERTITIEEIWSYLVKRKKQLKSALNTKGDTTDA